MLIIHIIFNCKNAVAFVPWHESLLRTRVASSAVSRPKGVKQSSKFSTVLPDRSEALLRTRVASNTVPCPEDVKHSLKFSTALPDRRDARPEDEKQGSKYSTALPDRREVLGAMSFALLVATLSPVVAVAAIDAAPAGKPAPNASEILKKAAGKAIGGGKAGAAAAVAQVSSLMWLRTLMNYQYKNGGSLPGALSTLWAEGGLSRLYQGFPFALVQGPLSRFGDTAANAFVLALLVDVNVDVTVKTVACSAAAGLWRIFLMPVDTVKTTYQVSGGEEGWSQLQSRLRSQGPSTLYEGALATSAATFIGHYPWFATYNFLSANVAAPLPGSEGYEVHLLVYNALLGLASSIVSDTCSNSVRVVKTTKQTSETPIGYDEALASVLEKGGLPELFGRGLETRFLVNGLQGMLFSVLWKFFQRRL